jgi:hypothetical protein
MARGATGRYGRLPRGGERERDLAVAGRDGERGGEDRGAPERDHLRGPSPCAGSVAGRRAAARSAAAGASMRTERGERHAPDGAGGGQRARVGRVGANIAAGRAGGKVAAPGRAGAGA